MRKKKKGSNELVRVYFFNRPGAGNTFKVIDAVKRRLRRGEVDKILVASESGRLALALKRSLGRTPMVCVTIDEKTRRRYRKPSLMRDDLLKQGIVIVDEASEPLGRELLFRNWWEQETIRLPGPNADLFWMSLICVGGHGLRTAVEIVFMAVEARAVVEGEKVVSVAGTGWGADSAIVMTACRFDNVVGVDQKKRMKIEEILAMPKQTKWMGYG